MAKKKEEPMRLRCWFLVGAMIFPGVLRAANLDTARIEQLTGLKGTWNEKEGVFKVTYPRTDLKVMAGSVHIIHITPAMGLTAWAAFIGAGDHTMVMGDMVLLEDQVNPVMSAALDNGLEVTALHNHFSGETPRILFMHIGGMGNEDRLAGAGGKRFGTLKDAGIVKKAALEAKIN